jgi:hypothetical protein
MTSRSNSTTGVYFCRGCGGPLPPGLKGLFHPECLKADKRRRVREDREKKRWGLERLLSRVQCPQCGARFAQQKVEAAPKSTGSK